MTTSKPKSALLSLSSLLAEINTELRHEALPSKALDFFNAFFYFMSGEGQLKDFYDPYFDEKTLKAD